MSETNQSQFEKDLALIITHPRFSQIRRGSRSVDFGKSEPCWEIGVAYRVSHEVEWVDAHTLQEAVRQMALSIRQHSLIEVAINPTQALEQVSQQAKPADSIAELQLQVQELQLTLFERELMLGAQENLNLAIAKRLDKASADADAGLSEERLQKLKKRLHGLKILADACKGQVCGSSLPQEVEEYSDMLGEIDRLKAILRNLNLVQVREEV